MLMKIYKILFLLITFLIFSCSSESETGGFSESKMSISPEMAMMEDVRISTPPTSLGNEEKKIQRNANISIEVKNLDESIDKLNEIILLFNAEIISSNKGGMDFGQPYANIRIRVLSGNLDSAINEFKKLSTKIISENIYTNDVTEEFIDTEARLKIMKSTEDRFNSLLLKSETVEEIIQVEKELMRIRGDIESLEGRLNYLSKTTDTSEINLNLNEQIPITGESWKINDSFTSALQNLSSFAKWLADFIINVIVFIPAIIVITLIILFLRKLIKNRKK
ncbi:MAG: hypothetical protein CMP44_01810 [Rickettsiales bacterium]|nr:hypothetical protein [Rickettsiales bacterium]